MYSVEELSNYPLTTMVTIKFNKISTSISAPAQQIRGKRLTCKITT